MSGLQKPLAHVAGGGPDPPGFSGRLRDGLGEGHQLVGLRAPGASTPVRSAVPRDQR